MGAAARRKQERIKLSEAQFFKLKAAIAQRALLQHQVQQQLAEAERSVNALMTECGLTPGVSYQMDEKKLTATVRS